MSIIRVTLYDTTKTKRRTIELPDDVPLRRIMSMLIPKLGWPIVGSQGEPISYRIHHHDQQLLEDQTLAQAGVHTNDDLYCTQETHAGMWL